VGLAGIYLGRYFRQVSNDAYEIIGDKKMEKVAALILAEINKGKTMEQAWDAVMGAGEYEKFVSYVYDKLRGE
jgi:hypothetical protein